MYEPYQCRGHTSVGAKPMSEHSNVRAIPMSEHTNVKAIPMYEPYHCRSQTDVRAFQCPSQCCVQPLVASTHFWTEQTTPTRRIAMYLIQSTDCHAHIALLRNYSNWQNMITTWKMLSFQLLLHIIPLLLNTNWQKQAHHQQIAIFLTDCYCPRGEAVQSTDCSGFNWNISFGMDVLRSLVRTFL